MLIHIIFILLILYLLFAISRGFITKKWAKKPIKITASVLVVMSILFADSYAGYYYWRYLCATDGGINVFKTVSVSGYEDMSVRRAKTAEHVLSKGYDFIEGSYYKDPEKLYRYHFGEDGEVLRDLVVTPRSKYILKREKHKSPLGIITYKYIIQSRDDEEVIAFGKMIGYIGGWSIRTIRDIVGFSGGSYCWNPFPINKLIDRTLIPNNQTGKNANKSVVNE